MYQQPFVPCKNGYCPAHHAPFVDPIQLPYANPPRTGTDQPDWPKEGWQIRIVCHTCKHWYVYQQVDVKWRPFQVPLERQTDLAFWRVELECGRSNCASRTIWHMLTSSTLTGDEVVAAVKHGEPPIMCAARHVLAPHTTVVSARRVYSV